MTSPHKISAFHRVNSWLGRSRVFSEDPATSNAPTAAERSMLLLPQHEQLITGSGIAPEVAQARGYRSATDLQELISLGFASFQARVPGLLIPVWDVTGEIATYQLRPDSPRKNSDGKFVKYETPAGSRLVLDIPPPVRDSLTDPSIPLWISEGARKADSGVSRGLATIALLGVWNWRGTNEHGGTTALACWDAVALKNRQVYVVFDNDAIEKPPVRAALGRLKAFLEQRNADVWIVYLPESHNA